MLGWSMRNTPTKWRRKDKGKCFVLALHYNGVFLLTVSITLELHGDAYGTALTIYRHTSMPHLPRCLRYSHSATVMVRLQVRGGPHLSCGMGQTTAVKPASTCEHLLCQRVSVWECFVDHHNAAHRHNSRTLTFVFSSPLGGSVPCAPQTLRFFAAFLACRYLLSSGTFGRRCFPLLF